MRYGEGAAKLEGANLTKFMTVLNEYLGFFDKVNKRVRDEKVTELLPQLDLSKRADFEGDKKTPPKKIEKLEKELKKLQKERKFKSVEARFDEEHNLWEVSFVNSQGAEHVINWELASTPEYRQMIVEVQADRALSWSRRLWWRRSPKAGAARTKKPDDEARRDGRIEKAGEEERQGSRRRTQATSRSGGEDYRARPVRLRAGRRQEGLRACSATKVWAK